MQRASGGTNTKKDTSQDERPAKRRRREEPEQTDSAARRSSSPELEPDAAAFIERQGELAGDTKWTLGLPEFPKVAPTQFKSTTFGWNEVGLDDSDSGEEDETPEEKSLRALTAGRFSFNGANPEIEKIQQRYQKLKKRRKAKEEGQMSESDDGASAKHDKEKKRGREPAVNLRELTSISNPGPPGTSSRGGFSSKIKCHKCSRPGHVTSQCPLRAGNEGRGRGRGHGLPTFGRGGGGLGPSHGKRSHGS